MELVFEQAFREEYRKSQRALAWKYLGLIFLGAAAVTLVQVFWLRGGRWYWFDLVLPGIVLDLWLALMHRGQQRWMARDFCLTEEGILEQDLRGRKRLVPWSMVIAVDKGTMAGFGQRSLLVLRCFLSAFAWEKSIPNLQQSEGETSIRNYYKLRKECIVIEYTSEREQKILELWHDFCGNGVEGPTEDLKSGIAPDKGFSNTFDEVSRRCCQVSLGVFLFIALLCGIGLPLVGVFFETSERELYGLLVGGFFGLVFMLVVVNADRPSAQWLLGRCKIQKNGIYIKPLWKKTTFVPWDYITEIERSQMSIYKSRSTAVICCYHNLTGKTRLERCPSIFNQGKKFQEFYSLHRDIVTIGYTKERMAKIRAFHRAATKK